MSYFCARERTPKNSLSPGIIYDDEPIAYIVFHPRHIDQEGRVSTAAFQTKQLEEGSLSTFRIRYSALSEIQEKVIKPSLDRSSATKVAGVLSVACGNIREIHDQYGQSFCVIDDPVEEFASHALIGFSEKMKTLSKCSKITARAELMRVFGKLQDIAEAFS